MRSLWILTALSIGACAGPSDRIILVRGHIVDEAGDARSGCTFSLTEARQASDRFMYKRDIDASFDLAITYWAPSDSRYQIVIDCQESAAVYRFEPARASRFQSGPIDLGRIAIPKRK